MDEHLREESLAYENIRITFNDNAIKLLNLKKFRMVHPLNDHARVFFEGAIGDDLFIQSLDQSAVIQVDYISKGIVKPGESETPEPKIKPWFKGLVTNVRITAANREYNYEIEGVSRTYRMDIELKKRSFQNVNLTYQALVDEITKEYNGVGTISMDFEKQNLKTFMLQFNETDWEFLKRIASQKNAPIAANPESDKVNLYLGANYYLGTPEETREGFLDETFYVITKRIADYRISEQNYRDDAEEVDFIGYEVLLEKVKYLKLGQCVTFLNQTLYVAHSELVVNLTKDQSSGTFYVKYVLVRKEGFRQNRLDNQKLKGASLQAKVVKVEKDRVKVQLDIDKGREQPADKSVLFPYMTPYTAENNTGWYCMPEVGDKVNLYFPTHDERDGVVIHSYREKAQGNDKINTPGTKYFRTKSGKELMFNDKEILITSKDGQILIRLNEDSGIEIQSNQKVKITAGGDLTIHSDSTVKVAAELGLDLACKKSSITLNDGLTHIKGTQIKTN